jgi:hypothetical protein
MQRRHIEHPGFEFARTKAEEEQCRPKRLELETNTGISVT